SAPLLRRAARSPCPVRFASNGWMAPGDSLTTSGPTWRRIIREERSVEIGLDPLAELALGPGPQRAGHRVPLGPAVCLGDPLAVLVGQFDVRPDDVARPENVLEPVSAVLLEELAVFPYGAELRVVHPHDAPDLHEPVNIVPVEGGEG